MLTGSRGLRPALGRGASLPLPSLGGVSWEEDRPSVTPWQVGSIRVVGREPLCLLLTSDPGHPRSAYQRSHTHACTHGGHAGCTHAHIVHKDVSVYRCAHAAQAGCTCACVHNALTQSSQGCEHTALTGHTCVYVHVHTAHPEGLRVSVCTRGPHAGCTHARTCTVFTQGVQVRVHIARSAYVSVCAHSQRAHTGTIL